jgi:16S rRNA (guanine527-N7)-methyltransferase
MSGGPDPDPFEALRERVDPRVVEILQRSAALGFLGSMPIADQIDHALGFVSVVESVLGRSPADVLDLGTGGGLPGLVLLSCWPRSHTVLLDASERRTQFLSSELEVWGRAGTVEVVRGRAEEVGRDQRMRHRFDLVTSRSFGPPAVTAECGAPLLADGGIMVVSEPPQSSGAERWPSAGLAVLGLTASTPVRPGGRFGYQVLEKSGSTPDRFPRRSGIPAKRPLF